MNNKKWSLCYIEGSFAYFTTNELSRQGGDDWDDVPYEHNAGEPYKWIKGSDEPEYIIEKVAWDGDFELPGYNELNSSYSVDMINKKMVPWLEGCFDAKSINIYAGVSIEDFASLIHKGGGDIYVIRSKKEGVKV